MHVILQGETLKISPQLEEVFVFLSNIEQEITDNIYIKEIFKKFPSRLEVNNYNGNTRIMSISLFAYLEVVFHLVTAYELQITAKDEVMRRTKERATELIKRYLLQNSNDFYANNKERLSKVTPKMIKDLRNRLTHFFSTGDDGDNILLLIENLGQEHASKLEEEARNKGVICCFLTPTDLYRWFSSGLKIILLERTQDSYVNSPEFDKKINTVLAVVEKFAVKMRKIKQK